MQVSIRDAHTQLSDTPKSEFNLNDTAWRILSVAYGSWVEGMSTEQIVQITKLNKELVFQTCLILEEEGFLVFRNKLRDTVLVKITRKGLEAIRDHRSY